MIYVDVRGNLGNQLFQYACARQIQEITGQKICMNTYFHSKYRPEYTFNLGEYVLNEDIIFEDKKPLPFYANIYKGILRVLKKFFPVFLFNILKKFGIFIWLKATYKELPLKKGKRNYYMVGYWQSISYFKDIEEKLRRELEPKKSLLPENVEIYERIKSTESVCITIRRGDYITNKKYRKTFFCCDTDYFLKGVELIRRDCPNAVLFVFSDDIGWVKENIHFSGQVYYESGKDPVWEKLRLMSACKHFIISNSSFSWWAQYLSNNENKIVYAPSKWYPDGRECDIYEEHWRYIEI